MHIAAFAGGAMPRFFFDVALDGQTLADELGDDLACLDAAKSEARLGLLEQARSRLAVGERFTIAITVRDGTGIRHVERIAVSCDLF